MINLINPDLWLYEAPCGNAFGQDATPAVMKRDNVVWLSDRVRFYVKNELCLGTTRDKDWNKLIVSAEYSIGHVLSKNQYGFGTYTLKCRLPNFRGAWPAFWFIDWLHKDKGGMGMPPEIDVFEHFRKDRFLTRFKLSCSYHDGPTYEDDHEIVANRWSWTPWDCKVVEFKLVWTATSLEYIVNGKTVLTVYRDSVQHFPHKPMNILFGTGVSDFRGKKALVVADPFEVFEFTYDAEN